MIRPFTRRGRFALLCLAALIGGGSTEVQAQAHVHDSRGACCVPAASRQLGTFYPTPYITVGGGSFTGSNGYTPLSGYGGGTLALYGPFSALRPVTAPVRVTTRGYDGTYREAVGVTTSYPFLPQASPNLFPLRRQVRGAGPVQTTPPWWDAGHYWVDFQ